nr:6304_t:CDS:2 [Entrophospora candida]CAG8529641.1 7279_t:CDS:2 [Entrophospora candida]
MAFQSIVNGAECSTSSNPMTQFIKQFNEDLSLQKEVFIPVNDKAGPSTFRTAGPEVDIQEKQYIEEFFEPNSILPNVTNFSNHRAKEWATEFENIKDSPHFMQYGPEIKDEMMEAAFKRANWNTEFMGEFQSNMKNQITEIPPEYEEVFQKNFDWASEFALKKKEKIDPTSWEEQFAAAQRDSEANKQYSSGADDIDVLEHDKKLFNEFENIWKNSANKYLNDDLIDYSAWDDKFLNFENMNSEHDFGEYIFESNNPFLEHLNPFEEGMKIINQGGSLSEAALAFEAAVKKDTNNSEAWERLGSAQAQNEKDEAAIRALQRAIEIDGNNLTALMIVLSSATMHNSQVLLSRVKELFLRAARNAPEGENIDPDVQVGLGVLFYANDEYEKAADCFNTALEVRKDDYLLWNKLGATLANYNKPEEAIEAYHKALSLRPTFVRARHNLGISCINIHCYREAVEHLLGALSMHKIGDDDSKNTSRSLRLTLSRAFEKMERKDLLDKILSGADVNEFRDEFEF